MDRAETGGGTVVVGGAPIGSRQRPDVDFGVLIFRKLFTHEELGSHVLRLFPFRNQARTLFVSAHLKLHAKLFVDTMTTLVANLHDLEKVERDLRNLGQRHLTYGVVLPEHFTLMGDALIAALDEARHRPSEEERDAWIETWGFIAKEMQRGRGKEIGIKSPHGSAPSSRRTSMEKKRSKGQSAA
tara:strand:+ start:723 stop:1277 length:555 start_codon:yes stop_codon:yes gene_type:complete